MLISQIGEFGVEMAWNRALPFRVLMNVGPQISRENDKVGTCRDRNPIMKRSRFSSSNSSHLGLQGISFVCCRQTGCSLSQRVDLNSDSRNAESMYCENLQLAFRKRECHEQRSKKSDIALWRALIASALSRHQCFPFYHTWMACRMVGPVPESSEM